VRRCSLGIVQSSSTAGAKGRICSAIAPESRLICSSRKSMWARIAPTTIPTRCRGGCRRRAWPRGPCHLSGAARVETDARRTDAEDDVLLADDRRTFFTARRDPRTQARPGSPLRISLDPAEFHFFDPVSGESLRTPQP